jgi:mannose-6-phosphate isomerase-like protein (cupin superfamily)
MTRSVDIARIETDWKERGFSFGVWTDPPGTAWEGYSHASDELFMVVEGVVEIEMRGVRSRLEIGEEVLVPAGIAHSVRNIGPLFCRWLYGYKR